MPCPNLPLHLVILAVAVSIAASTPTHGAPRVQADAGTSQGTSTGTQTATSGGVSDMETGGSPGFAANASASAQHKLLRAYSAGEGTASSSGPGSIFSRATASFRDDLLFNAPGLTDTSGTFTAYFTISGAVSVNANRVPGDDSSAFGTGATVSYAYGIDADALTAPTKSYRLRGDGSSFTFGGPFLGIQQAITLPITFGRLLENVVLSISVNTTAFAHSNGYTSSVVADLSQTARWVGIGEVRDSGGNLVSNYSLTSSSGADYTVPAPVPEPTTAILTLLPVFSLLKRSHRSTLKSPTQRIR